jgi:hypothetical protein
VALTAAATVRGGFPRLSCEVPRSVKHLRFTANQSHGSPSTRLSAIQGRISTNDA